MNKDQVLKPQQSEVWRLMARIWIWKYLFCTGNVKHLQTDVSISFVTKINRRLFIVWKKMHANTTEPKRPTRTILEIKNQVIWGHYEVPRFIYLIKHKIWQKDHTALIATKRKFSFKINISEKGWICSQNTSSWSFFTLFNDFYATSIKVEIERQKLRLQYKSIMFQVYMKTSCVSKALFCYRLFSKTRPQAVPRYFLWCWDWWRSRLVQSFDIINFWKPVAHVIILNWSIFFLNRHPYLRKASSARTSHDHVTSTS